MKAGKITLKKPEGKKALDYLKDVRKLSDQIIDLFNIGYCPESVNHQLKGRIITPIYETFGELVALSTRLIEKNVKNRFMHESFDKGSYLYGLNFAKETIYKLNKVIIVEGEFDVLYFHSNGFTMTVGLCGSALTLFQISLLARYCNEFYLLLDGDTSGRNSINRIMKLYDDYNLEAYKLKFIPVFLPKDCDPDEFLIQNGKNKMKEKLAEARKDNIF